MSESAVPIVSIDHGARKGGVNLYLREKYAESPDGKYGTILFVHGSSWGATPTFDLQVPGRDDASVMDWFARRGFNTWCVDMEGYGRSDKQRPIRSDVADGADDLAAASEYIMRTRDCGPLLVYGISSGALRAGLFAQRHPERVRRLALDALVWTGKGSRTLAERGKKLDQFKAGNRRPLDRAFIRSVFTRDHPGVADDATVDAFAAAVLALDDSAPTGTYIDMCSRLPVNDPEQITVPTLVLRGEFDGIAAFDDVLEFFRRLPHPAKQFVMLPGIAHASFQERNYLLVYHALLAFFTQPEPVYRG